ncbi:TIGR02450 family Trp-rich protein [Candidatus Gracilibacteria bacterium]|nr:TIGR02450 family Trp-rich protein [Candidatus Gracilibacteria bacterium]NJM89794.1 TIGR02450 family Trp-rich protein [Hydrococcus sp. RU_2_2]NJP18585.1 TIGR02450 family Trp-rich protein [Hydrococcus sp. CRU_1_1]NJQ98046.1 TIGR02450 family Trp-rich protein [Hydrococcus sp. CSU_1_8]
MPNKQKFAHLLGSKWTAKQTTWGWRHFQVINRREEGQWVFAEMVASCDPKVRFWINAKQLKDRSLWQSGWQTLAQMNQSEEDHEFDY